MHEAVITVFGTPGFGGRCERPDRIPSAREPASDRDLTPAIHFAISAYSHLRMEVAITCRRTRSPETWLLRSRASHAGVSRMRRRRSNSEKGFRRARSITGALSRRTSSRRGGSGVADLMNVERTGEAFEGEVRLTVVGRRLQPGDPAPDFELDTLDPISGAAQTVRLDDSAGTVRLLNVVNSVDTPVCHVETRRWDALRADLPNDVRLYTVSMDLPFALARWRTAEGAAHSMLSAHRSEQFGRDYGVLLKEWRLLQRAVFVVDRRDRIAHVEYVSDQMTEPDYGRTIEAVRRLTA